uniref:14.2 kDa salivary protein SP01 n=1 Tax=Phlebotomus argentipes TaxID=94469 RepID=Q0ZSU8_PHLAR|nr:14.2 kDa salivary protein SP01 [Phlebotomus argentipes]
MKQLSFILLVVAALTLESNASSPKEICEKRHQDDDICVTYCEYSYYGFTNDEFKLDDEHINKLKDVLLNFEAIKDNEVDKTVAHLKKCANEAKAKQASDNTRKNCYSIVHYQRCAYVNDIFTFSAYDEAIRKNAATISITIRK